MPDIRYLGGPIDNPASWQGGQLPTADDVIVLKTGQMLLDPDCRLKAPTFRIEEPAEPDEQPPQGVTDWPAQYRSIVRVIRQAMNEVHAKTRGFPPLTRDKNLEYVATLSPEMQKLYREADAFVMAAADTLDESFQVAAEVVRVFERRASRSYHGLKASPPSPPAATPASPPGSTPSTAQ